MRTAGELNNIRSKNSAFTLVESLLAAALLATVSIAVYAAIASGLKIWERHHIFQEGAALIFFEKADFELRNGLNYSRIPFHGTADRLSFPTVVKTPADRKKGKNPGAIEEQIGKVEYYFDAVKHGIYRRQANYGQALQNHYGQWHLLIGGLKSATFSYFHRENENLTKNKESESLPALIGIGVEFDKPAGQTLSRYVYIPTGK